MNMRTGLAALIVVALASCGTTESSKAGWEGGAKFERGTTVAIADLNKSGESMAGKQVQIEGTVKSMCKGKGCWVEVSDGTQTVIAKSPKDAVLFPKDSVGKKVVVQGIVRVNPAEACGEGSSEGSSHGEGHECPKPELLVEIQGAQLP